MDRTAEIEQNINEWTEGHRHWLATAIRECGHHAMYFNKSRGFCVCCRAESGFVSLEAALELAFPEEQKAEEDLLVEVYAPKGQVGHYGFFGGGPATQRQSAYLRYLLSRYKGNPHVEAIRAHLNRCRESENGIRVADVTPAIAFLKSL